MHTQVLIPLATLEDAIDVFHAKVVNELASYDRFWSEVETDMKWEGMVDEFPTPLAISLKSSKMIDVEKMGCNPRYLQTLFDVMKWWTVHGAKLYPKLAVAAVIILAKAAHNGFQERVFSIGAFLDTKQKQQLTKVHYEMDSLFRCNRGIMLESKLHLLVAINNDMSCQEKDKTTRFNQATDAFEASTKISNTNDDHAEAIIDVGLEEKESTVIFLAPNEEEEGKGYFTDNLLVWNNTSDEESVTENQP